ncbi:metal tolerance protein C4-like isoform X2 [Cucurbita maxima]|uniref:Metal tolerance protein C4-like isoform X2 n=1 Tax=Cucurbita maxima TaxID=3661 RepID=A0A6J1JTJ4_CUCMA|nr:metal tolerance protein C4-like isoform X2 [Cucurbita maxima]
MSGYHCSMVQFSCLLSEIWGLVCHMKSCHVGKVVHSVADFANQALLAYGLSSSRRAPDALHPYGYSKERFVWSLISAVGIFCLGADSTIVNGIQNLWTSQDGAAVTDLIVAAASLVAVSTTGNAIYDPVGSVVVGNLLGMHVL